MRMAGGAVATGLEAAFRRLPVLVRWIGLLLAVGTLIEFLPLDLAVVAVSVAALHASIGLGIAWQWLGARTGMRRVSPSRNGPGAAMGVAMDASARPAGPEACRDGSQT